MKNKPANILVTEDDHDLAWMLYSMLTSKGFTVTLAHSVGAAAGMLEERSFDLLIMDMLLQGVNGTDLCRSLKKDPRSGKIPIIMMSAHPDGERLCLEAGAQRFIHKPFELARLLSMIQVLLYNSVPVDAH